MPLAHVSIPVSDVKASTAFYTTLLAPLGYTIFKQFEHVVGFGPKHGAPDFWIHRCPEALASDPAAKKAHVAFDGASPAAVRTFYDVALKKAGARDNGPPGERPQYVAGYYAAFVLDPDGHNIECVCFRPLWLVALQAAPAVLAGVAVAGAWWAGRQGWFVS